MATLFTLHNRPRNEQLQEGTPHLFLELPLAAGPGAPPEQLVVPRENVVHENVATTRSERRP
jgi:hypothetical protein